MSRSVWRIATDARTWSAEDLSGAGARMSGGRWNELGTAMVYCSGSRALACLETVVHLNAGGLPLNRYLVEVQVPDDIWQAAEVAAPEVGWDAEPASHASVDFGTDWVAENRSALLLVPSVIVPEETNVLVNPAHPGSRRITARKLRKWLYDPRLVRRS